MNKIVNRCFSATSVDDIFNLLRLNGPPAQVHGGHNTNNSGGVSLTNFFT